MDRKFLTSYYILKSEGYCMVVRSVMMDESDLTDVDCFEVYMDFDNKPEVNTQRLSFEEAIYEMSLLEDCPDITAECLLLVGDPTLEGWRNVEDRWRSGWGLDVGITEAVKALKPKVSYAELLWLMEEFRGNIFNPDKYAEED